MTSGVSKERELKRAQVGEIRITIRCANFPELHIKALSLEPSLGTQYAKTFAGLLCGTSPYYLRRPGPMSPIGKCATCGAQLSYEIEERTAL